MSERQRCGSGFVTKPALSGTISIAPAQKKSQDIVFKPLDGPGSGRYTSPAGGGRGAAGGRCPALSGRRWQGRPREAPDCDEIQNHGTADPAKRPASSGHRYRLPGRLAETLNDRPGWPQPGQEPRGGAAPRERKDRRENRSNGSECLPDRGNHRFAGRSEYGIPGAGKISEDHRTHLPPPVHAGG